MPDLDSAGSITPMYTICLSKSVNFEIFTLGLSPFQGVTPRNFVTPGWLNTPLFLPDQAFGFFGPNMLFVVSDVIAKNNNKFVCNCISCSEFLMSRGDFY